MATVLLVEENELNQDMLSRRLRRKGYEVTIAADGEQAIRMVAKTLPDLVLMDINLPGRDGHDITRELKAGPHTCAIPVIALTANAMASDREAAIAAGCDDFDTKPVELSRLLSKMEAALNRADPAS
ncbi:MAG: response regulator [Wenzhouxiangellaceae bacterium]|nr:response regulator [Wenzhouxiangellaceae bacterium]